MEQFTKEDLKEEIYRLIEETVTGGNVVLDTAVKQLWPLLEQVAQLSLERKKHGACHKDEDSQHSIRARTISQ